MIKYRVIISIVGFILQVVLFFLFAHRLGYWNTIGFFYCALSVIILVYNAVFDRKPTLRKYSIIYCGGVILAAFLSGIVAGFESVALAWLLLAGIVTGIWFIFWAAMTLKAIFGKR